MDIFTFYTVCEVGVTPCFLVSSEELVGNESPKIDRIRGSEQRAEKRSFVKP